MQPNFSLLFLDVARPAVNLTAGFYERGGTSLQLLVGSPVQSNGYLISWRFYHGRIDGEVCESYAAIWRENIEGAAKYQLVDGSDKLLDSGNEPGVYNMNVKHRVVRVKRGDLVSIHVKKSQTCTYNRVGFQSQGWNPVMTNEYANVTHPPPSELPTNGLMVSQEEKVFGLQLYLLGIDNCPRSLHYFYSIILPR